MKALLVLAAVLAIACCQVYPFNVANECSSAGCSRSSWRFNNTNYNYTCPKAGQLGAKFRAVNGLYVFDFTAYNTFSSDTAATIPLTYNANATSNGLQYYANLDNGHFFAILNCTIPSSRNFTNLCSKHELVGGKIYNNTFQNSCAFGLDRPRFAFLQQEMPLEFEMTY